MFDPAALTPEAKAYYDALPTRARIAMEHSNLPLYTLEDLKAYESDNLESDGTVLYQRLPEPGIPSNAALDPLDSD